MKSFQDFVQQSHLQEAEVVQPSFKGIGKKYIKKGSSEIEKARKALEKTPTLSDAEMRAQNPGPTAAYEKDAAERKSRRTVTVKTPEGQITAGGATKSGKIPFQTSSGKTIHVTPDEAIARAESQSKTKIVKKKIKKTPTIVKPSTPEVAKPPEVKPTVAKSAAAKIELPKSTRTAAQKAQPGLYKIPTSRQLPSPSPTPIATKTPSKEVKLPKPAKPKLNRPKAYSKGIEKSITSALQADREAASAAKNIEKAAKASKVVKGFKVATRIATPVAAGLDAYGGYQAARETGASQKRSIGAGIARAAGGLIGGAAGGAVGSVLGPAGSIAGTIGGYGAGSELGTKVYNKLTGPVGKDFKVSDLSKNIKSGITSGKKSFKSFVAQADKSLSRYA